MLLSIGGGAFAQSCRHGPQAHHQGDKVPAAEAGPFSQGHQATTVGQHGKLNANTFQHNLLGFSQYNI